MSKKIALSSQKNRTDNKQGQNRGVMTPHCRHTRRLTCPCTDAQKRTQTESEPHPQPQPLPVQTQIASRQFCCQLEILSLVVDWKHHMVKCFFMVLMWVMAHLAGLDRAGSTHIQMPPAHPHLRTHTHTHAHIKQDRAGVCGKAKTWNRWLTAGSCSLSLCVDLYTIYIYLLSISSCAFSLNLCLLYFHFCDFLHSTFFRS